MAGDEHATDAAPPPPPPGGAAGGSAPGAAPNWKKKLEGVNKVAGVKWKAAKEKALDTESGKKAKAWSAAGAEKMDARIEKLSGTSGGKKIADGARKVGSVAAKLPLITAMGDSVKMSNGVDLLTAAVKEDPKRPEPKIHLVLALQRVERDMAQVRTAKAIYKPQTLVTRTLLQKSAAMGVEDDMAMTEKLLRAAFKQALAIKEQAPADAVNLHSLARVYLLQSVPETARQLARLSLSAGHPHPGDVYVTLANVESLVENTESVAEYAELAVKHGSTLGYSVLAELAMTGPGTASEQAKQYAEWASRVDPADEERYYGVRLDPDRLDTLRRLAKAQKGKAVDLKESFSDRAATLKEQSADSSHDEPASDDSPPSHPPADWYTDPYGRHDHRYWDGTAWTDHVATAGQQSVDPIDGSSDPNQLRSEGRVT
ncbi:MAG: DUF2510 domain-containing protein [Acidimicrobiales bacterium]|nr:DUF2510 domain-containing protein [Acidimicrobiales bacterium]